MKKRIYLEDYWIKSDGEVVQYEEMDEDYAKNLLSFLKHKRMKPSRRLTKHIENIEQVKLKKLF